MFRAPKTKLYLNWQDVQIAEELRMPLDDLETRREGQLLVVTFGSTQERDRWHERINARISGRDAHEPK